MATPLFNITSANSIYTLVINSLFVAPQQLAQFETDSAFETEAVEVAETRMGVDGFMSAGWIPQMTKQTFMFMASSPSIAIFEAWASAQNVQRQTYNATGQIAIPAVGRKYTLTNGVLTSYTSVPSVKKVLEGRQFVVTWGSITVAPA